jgi:hypothetical protein
MIDYAIALTTLQQADPKLGQLIDQVGLCRLDQVQQQGDVFASLLRSIPRCTHSGRPCGNVRGNAARGGDFAAEDRLP